MVMRALAFALTLLAGSALASPAAADLTLLMIEQPGCVYCARWDRDIAPILPKTDEGRAAPLRRIQLREPVPDDITLDRPASFTPTFVMLKDGHETARIEGYPGDEFFWPLLRGMIDRASMTDTPTIPAPQQEKTTP